MKYDFLIDKDKNFLLERFEGEITFQSFSAAIQESLNHPDWRKGQNVLCDLREATLGISIDEMRQILDNGKIVDRDVSFPLGSQDHQKVMQAIAELLEEHTNLQE